MPASKIFVVNLDKSTDRWEQIEGQLDNSRYFYYERLSAVYGKDLSQEEIAAITTPMCAKYCTKSMIGCAASHVEIWKRAVDLNLDYAIVLEDDAVLAPGWDEALSAYLNDASLNFDVLLLGCHYFNPPVLAGTAQRRLEEPFRDGKQYTHHRQVTDGSLDRPDVKVANFFTGTHGYVASREGLKILLSEFSDGISWHIDVAMANRDLLIMQTIPELVTVDSRFDSDIAQKSILMAPIPNFELKGANSHWILGVSICQVHGFEVILIHIVFVVLVVLVTMGLVCRRAIQELNITPPTKDD
jgi:GR25 family glycosyltransferase involved in LPS biosynthesis